MEILYQVLATAPAIAACQTLNKTSTVTTVKSRIELNKRLHYTPLVPLIALLLVRSTLSYMQIKSLLS